MMDKDKLFLVCYLNIDGIPGVDVNGYLYTFGKSLDYDESIEKIIVPIRKGESRVECINPVLLTDEQYKEVEEKVKNLKKEVETVLKALNNDKR
jgi:hypothetical protein